MERAWRRLQYRPPPLPSNQVARDVAFRPSQAPDHRSLPQPNTMATASFASFAAAPPALPTSLATASSCARPVVLPGPAVLVRHSASVLTLRAGTDAAAGAREWSNACAVPSLWWIRPHIS
ncbi:hypothetical protein MRX96_015495 [Rhipicephalus microplus]